MNIKISPARTREAGDRLLDASRRLRRYQEETEHIMNELRDESELDGCRMYLRRQCGRMEKETADIVHLSAAIGRITEAYTRNEMKSADLIAGERLFITGEAIPMGPFVKNLISPAPSIGFADTDQMRAAISRILSKK